MNRNHNQPLAHGQPPHVNRATKLGQQFRPTGELKNNICAQSRKNPVAPPVYRPQPQPKVAQQKQANIPQPRSIRPGQTCKSTALAPRMQPNKPEAFRQMPTAGIPNSRAASPVIARTALPGQVDGVAQAKTKPKAVSIRSDVVQAAESFFGTLLFGAVMYGLSRFRLPRQQQQQQPPQQQPQQQQPLLQQPLLQQPLPQQPLPQQPLLQQPPLQQPPLQQPLLQQPPQQQQQLVVAQPPVPRVRVGGGPGLGRVFLAVNRWDRAVYGAVDTVLRGLEQARTEFDNVDDIVAHVNQDQLVINAIAAANEAARVIANVDGAPVRVRDITNGTWRAIRGRNNGDRELLVRLNGRNYSLHVHPPDFVGRPPIPGQVMRDGQMLGHTQTPQAICNEIMLIRGRPGGW